MVNVKILSGFFLLCGFLTVYFSQVIYQFFPQIKVPLLIIFIAGVPVSLILRQDRLGLILFFMVSLFCVALLLVGAESGLHSMITNMSFVFFYFTIFLGLLFSFYFEQFYSLLKIFVVLNSLAMGFEFLTSGFIMEPTSDSENFLGRAKGLISYSKEAGSFIILFTLMFIKRLDRNWFPILLFFALMTGSRLAMIAVFSTILIESFTRFKIRDMFSVSNIVFFIVFILIVVIGGVFYVNSGSSEIIMNRLSASFDVNSTSNSARIGFWLDYFDVLSGYDLYSLMFGYPGKAGYIINNGAENSYLSLLTDGGFLALFIYILSFYIMYYLLGANFRGFLTIILLILVMQVSRVNIGFIDGTIYWATFWFLLKNQCLNEFNENENENENENKGEI